MIRHIVLFRFVEDAPADRRTATMDALRNLGREVPGVRGMLVGPDVAGRGTFDFGLTCDFASDEDLRVYAEHPAHKEVIASFVKPYTAPGPEVLDFLYDEH